MDEKILKQITHNHQKTPTRQKQRTAPELTAQKSGELGPWKEEECAAESSGERNVAVFISLHRKMCRSRDRNIFTNNRCHIANVAISTRLCRFDRQTEVQLQPASHSFHTVTSAAQTLECDFTLGAQCD